MAQYSGINAALDSPQKDLRLAVFAATDEVKVLSRGTPRSRVSVNVGNLVFGVCRGEKGRLLVLPLFDAFVLTY